MLNYYRKCSKYEVPGGHREENERIIDTAKRELFEETGAYEYDIKPVCVYSVIAKLIFNKGQNDMIFNC
ncbi:MAG: NUDIX domain-containing protein [Clostridium sp.]|uniref:NUDIX domain-containing protein n=1 Tax=Clostridium sp. TaxID=1506 RepID=UPI0039ED5948